MSVKTKSPAVAEMHAQGAAVRALLGGTKAMRLAGRKYLPQWPQESDEAYKARLNTSTLLPAMRETVNQMVGRVFFQEIELENVSDGLKAYMPNIDLRNNSLSVFCSAWFRDALAHGASYVLVDYPRGGSAKTRADEKALNLRPYLVHIQNEDVLGFRHELRNGVNVCVQFRYIERVTVEDGEFGEKVVEQVVVLEPGRVRRFRPDSNGEMALHEDVVLLKNGKPLDYVPVVDLVPEPLTPFAGRVPLEDLADLNVKHWQSQSDQDNITHYVRVPLLMYQGQEDIASITSAAGNMISVGAEGSLSYIEHSGKAIEAGERHLEKLENDMRIAGAKLLDRTKMALTDSQARDEQGKEISKLRHYANLLEDAVGRALDLMAQWQGSDNGGFVEISGNIEADFNPTTSLDVLIKMNASGVVSDETLFNEAKRRGVVSSLAEWEAEKVRLESQAADMKFEENKAV